MAFTDPQTLTINAVPFSLARVETEGGKSLYSTSDANVKMTISHQPTKGRIRRMVRVDKRIIAADPFNATIQGYQNLGVYVVIDQPEYGYFTITDIDNVVQAFKTWLATANVTKVCGGES